MSTKRAGKNLDQKDGFVKIFSFHNKDQRYGFSRFMDKRNSTYA